MFSRNVSEGLLIYLHIPDRPAHEGGDFSVHTGKATTSSILLVRPSMSCIQYRLIPLDCLGRYIRTGLLLFMAGNYA